MTHLLGTTAASLGTAAASLLLTIVALVALQPCPRHDAEHAVGVITNDLREPIVCELGVRDMETSAVTLIRRDRTRNGERIESTTLPRSELAQTAGALLTEIQNALHAEARTRLLANISSRFLTFDDLEAYFKDSTDTDAFRGWAEVAWARPEGVALEVVDAKLKALKLTIRNAPLQQESAEGRRCVFSDAPAKELVLVGRAY